MQLSNSVEGKRVIVTKDFWVDEETHLEAGTKGRITRLYWADDAVLKVTLDSGKIVHIIEPDNANLELETA